MADKTIKELADELGVSKQAIRKYFDKLPPELIPTKSGNSYTLSEDIQRFIKSKVSTVDIKEKPTVDTSVDILKNQLLNEKDNQIKHLKSQNSELLKLLDQQQQLQLKTQEMLEEKTLLLETEKSKKWWKFWI